MSISVTFSIPGKQAPEFKERIRQEARKRGMTISEFVIEALAEFLRNHHE